MHESERTVRNTEFEQLQGEFVGHLFRLNAVRFEGPVPFKLHDVYRDATKISAYVDNRVVLGDADARSAAILLYKYLAQNLRFQHVAGIPTGAVPHGAFLAEECSVGLVDLQQELLTGHNEVLLLVEDTVSLATSAIPHIDALRQNNHVVNDIVALYTWEIGGREVLKEHGVHLHVAITPEVLLSYALQHDYIRPEMCMEIIAQRNRLAGYLHRAELRRLS